MLIKKWDLIINYDVAVVDYGTRCDIEVFMWVEIGAA